MTHVILHPSPGLRKITLSPWPKGSETPPESPGAHHLKSPEAEAEPGHSAGVKESGTLPSAPEVRPPVMGAQASKEEVAARILLVDDSATVREIVTLTLREAGYEVHAFPDGIQAMHWLTASSSPPDLLLVDLGLPKMDGYEVIRRIKAKAPFAHTPCLILSRRDGKIDHLKGRLAGATTSLGKPFTVQTLLTAVQTALTTQS
ncbi:MAG TPA: response regulator transcription factor [Ktedonosporobacter sp.]|nr:response regulator transcription factor [Ktedonosporobacter sp.]